MHPLTASSHSLIPRFTAANRLPHFRQVIAALILTLAAAQSSLAADASWSNAGGGGGNWTESAAWTPAAAPGLSSGATTSTDTATFDSSTRTTNSTVAVDTGRNIGNITFNTTNTFGYTLNGGPLVLSDGGTVFTTGNGTGQSTIHSPMTLQGNYTFTANSNLQFNNAAATFTAAAGLGAVTMNIGGSYAATTVLATGNITQGAGSTLSIVKTGTGSWQFNGANTFSGGLTVKAGFFGTGSSTAMGTGTLTLGDSSGSANATVGFGSNVSANNAISVAAGSNGTLSFTRTGGFGPSTVSGPINLANNLTISQNANNGQNFNISSNITGTGDVTVKSLQGTGTTTLSGSIDMTGHFINSGVSASPTVVSGVIGSNVASVTQNSSMSQLTLSNSNTYSGGTTVNRGTLLLSGAFNLPETGTLQVNAGGKFSLADGPARTTTTTASLGLADGAGLAFDWNADTVDMLTSTAAATTAGNVGIFINNISPTGSGGTLISSPSGGLATTNGTRYFLANNTNYTAALAVSDTAVSVGAQTAVSAPTLLFWQGNKVLGIGTEGADNALALSSGTTSNWSTTAGNYTATGVVPGSTADVIFSSANSPEQQNTVMGADMTLKSVTFDDGTAVTIGGNCTLTLTSTVATAGNGTAGGGSAITVTSASADPTIAASVILGPNQVWNVAADKTLTVSGTVSGTGSLTKADAGSVTLTGALNTTNTAGSVIRVTGGTSGTSSILTLSPTSTSNTGATSNNNSVSIGDAFNDYAVFNQTAGTVNSTSISIGNLGTGTYNFSGGISNTNGLTMSFTGPQSGTGETFLNIGGSSALNIYSNGKLTMGTYYGRKSTIVQTGGNVSFYGDAGRTLGGTGGLAFNGGVGNYTLSGGTLAVPNITWLASGGGAGGGTGTVNLNGGTLKITSASLSIPAQVSMQVQGSGAVSNSGANIDTNGLVINFNAPLVHYSGGPATDGGLTKTGAGTLNLSGANTYTGATTVSAGTLVLSGGASINSSSLVAVAGGTTLTNNTTTALTAPLSLYELCTLNGTGNFTTTILTIIGDLSGGSFDAINSTEYFAASGSLAFTLTNTEAGTYDLFTANPASFSFTSVSVGALQLVDSGGTFTASDGSFSYTFVNGTDVIEIVAVPEPGTWGLVALSLALLLYRKPRYRVES